jgi:hypothetical protein
MYFRILNSVAKTMRFSAMPRTSSVIAIVTKLLKILKGSTKRTITILVLIMGLYFFNASIHAEEMEREKRNLVSLPRIPLKWMASRHSVSVAMVVTETETVRTP